MTTTTRVTQVGIEADIELTQIRTTQVGIEVDLYLGVPVAGAITIEDSLTLTDTVTSGGPSGRLSTSRNHPHRGKYYLAVHNPTKLVWGEVDGVTPDVGGTEVTYINSGGDRLELYWGMTVKVYDSAGTYKGKVRLRRGWDASTLTVAEQDDLDWTIGDRFEIYDVIELWARFPRVVIDPGDPEKLIWYRDWDLTPAATEYPMQTAHTMCVPVIGPPTCAFLKDGAASVYFTAKESYNVNPLTPPAWWLWRFYDTSVLGWDSSNLETPGYFTWTDAGVYRVQCQVETGIPGWPGYPATRYIHIFERTGANAPYTNFNVLNLSGSVSEGGWNAEFEVCTDVDIADFPEGAQVILFAEEELGGYDFGSEEPPEYRSEVKYVGYIVGGSVTKDPGTRVTRFRTSGIQTQMKNRDNFSLALDYADVTTADTWVKQDVLTPNYAFMNLIFWNSTLMRVADVLLPAYYYELWQSISHKASEYLVKYQDFSRGTLWRQIDSLATDVFARIIVDRFGGVSICNDPQYTIEANLLADLPVPYPFGTLDWEIPLIIEFVDEPVVSVVSVEGVAFDGATATAVIGYHPGELPTYRGHIQTKSGCVLSSQNEAEFLAQGLFSIQNNTYPRVIIKCLGNYSFVDLADLGGIQISLAAADTRYGLAWDNKRFFVEAVSNAIDFQTGLLTTELQLVAFAYLRHPGIGAIIPTGYLNKGVLTFSGDLVCKVQIMYDVISADALADKHYKHVGFSANIDSSYTSPGISPIGIAWDGTNVISVDFTANKHYKHTGFSSTIDSSYTSPSTNPRGITWDGTNVISADDGADRHYKHVGFSDSIDSSYLSPSTVPYGITWDGTNVVSVDWASAKHYKHTGFSASIDSSYTSPSSEPTGITWDGTNVLSVDDNLNKHYKHMGFSDTIDSSYSSPDSNPQGITWDGRYASA